MKEKEKIPHRTNDRLKYHHHRLTITSWFGTPPEANVEPHSHPEAETFYILKVNLLFLVEGVNEPKICKIVLSWVPHVTHSFKIVEEKKVRYLEQWRQAEHKDLKVCLEILELNFLMVTLSWLKQTRGTSNTRDW